MARNPNALSTMKALLFVHGTIRLGVTSQGSPVESRYLTSAIVGPSGGAGEKLFVFVCVCCLGKRAHKDSDEQ